MLTANDIDAAVERAVALVEAGDYTSFVEIERAIPNFGASDDEHFAVRAGNALIWVVSEFGAEVAIKLLSRVAICPSSMLVYLIDGKLIRPPKPDKFFLVTLRPLRFADFVTPNGVIMALGTKRLRSTTRGPGKAAIAEGKRKARGLVATLP
jgi:hypothetical protein